MGIKGWNVALGIVLLLVSSAAFAGNAAAVRRQIESSMLLTGKIQVDAAGLPGTRRTTRTRCRPASWADRQGRPFVGLEPTRLDGKPAQVSTDMCIRVVARKLDQGDYEVAIRSASLADVRAIRRRTSRQSA